MSRKFLMLNSLLFYILFNKLYWHSSFRLFPLKVGWILILLFAICTPLCIPVDHCLQGWAPPPPSLPINPPLWHKNFSSAECKGWLACNRLKFLSGKLGGGGEWMWELFQIHCRQSNNSSWIVSYRMFFNRTDSFRRSSNFLKHSTFLKNLRRIKAIHYSGLITLFNAYLTNV